MKRLLRFTEHFCVVLSAIGAIAVIVMVLLVTFSSCSRYVFGIAVNYMEEVAGLLLMVVSFSSFAYVFVKRGHIRVELILAMLPKGLKYYLELVNKIILLVYLIIFTKIAYDFVVVSYRLDCHTPDANLYEVPWMAVMPLSGLIFAVVVFMYCLRDIFDMITGKNKEMELEKTPVMEEATKSF